MMYGIVWIITLVLVGITGSLKCLFIPAIAYCFFIVYEGASQSRREQQRLFEYFARLSELRNMTIDAIKDKNSGYEIAKSVNPLEVNVKSLQRVICECFNEFEPRKIADVNNIMAVVDDYEQMCKHNITWRRVLVDLANYLVVERDRIKISEAKKKQIKTQDRELPNA